MSSRAEGGCVCPMSNSDQDVRDSTMVDVYR